MTRCLGCALLLVGVTATVGCEEQSLDVPLILPDNLGTGEGESANAEQLNTTVADDWIGNPPHGSSEPTLEEEEPSATRSVWNALLEGASYALDETEPTP